MRRGKIGIHSFCLTPESVCDRTVAVQNCPLLCSYLVQKVFKILLHNSHDFFMFYGYHITINRKTSDIDAAYKIFFIILELISDYQLSSLFQIIILLKKSTRRGAFFHVFFSKRIFDKFHFAFISAVSGTCFQLEKTWADSIITLKL